MIGQLAEVLAPQYTAEQLEENFDDLRQTPLKPAIVAVGIPESARVAILEHIEDYPGTKVKKLTVRHYPQGQLAAHLLGYTGEISDEQLATRREAGYQEGRERSARTAPSARSRPTCAGRRAASGSKSIPATSQSAHRSTVEPGTIGNDVVLTIDANWQSAAETALAQGIASAREQPEREHQEQALRDAQGAGRRRRRDGCHRRFGRRDGVVPDLRRRASSSTASARPNGRH